MNALQIIKDKKALVLSGGGTLGLGEIGALSKLDELGLDIKNFTSITGSSVGSIIAMGIACGASVDYMKEKMNVDFKKLKNDKCVLVEAYNLIKDYGFHDMSEIRKFVSEILIDLVGDENITFRQLFNKTGKWLTITYLSFNYERTIFADHVFEPDSLIRETVIKSSSIPIFFEAYFQGKEVIGDGGILLNFPTQVAYLQGYKPKDILGLKFISKGFRKVKDEGQPGTPEEFKKGPTNIIQYLYSLIQISRTQAMKVHVNEEDWKNTVKINVGTLTSTDFAMSQEDKDWLFKQGRIAAYEYLLELEDLIQDDKY